MQSTKNEVATTIEDVPIIDLQTFMEASDKKANDVVA